MICKLKNLFLSAVIALSACQFGVPAGAFDMGLAPVKVDETLLPGTEKTVVYSFTNASTLSSIRIQVLVNDWDVNERGKLIHPRPGTYKYSASNWVEVSPSEFVCKPRETQLVRATYRVPADAKPGDYLTSLMFRQRVVVPPVKARSMGRVIPQGLVGSITYISVPQVEKKGALEGMRFVPAVDKEPAKFELTIKNAGNTRLRPTGNLQITDKEGKTVYLKDLSEIGVVLRETVGIREVPIEEKLATGRYDAVINLKFDKDLNVGERGKLAFDYVPAPPVEKAPVAKESASKGAPADRSKDFVRPDSVTPAKTAQSANPAAARPGVNAVRSVSGTTRPATSPSRPAATGPKTPAPSTATKPAPPKPAASTANPAKPAAIAPSATKSGL